MYRKTNPKSSPKRLEYARAYSAKRRKERSYREQMRAYHKLYRRKHKERLTKKARDYQRKHALHINLRRKGLTLKDYERVLKKQGLTCAICKGSPDGKWKKYNIDHCHETGKIRGLLCKGCNQGLGLFHDNAKLLIRASKYLKGKL